MNEQGTQTPLMTAACKRFLNQRFGPDLVMPIFKYILPSPRNRQELIKWVDQWIMDNDDNNVDNDDNDESTFVDPISCWDVSQITNFEQVFNAWRNRRMESFNEPLYWDTSNAINMERMFEGCKAFTGRGLAEWNVSNVTNMNGMLHKCIHFQENVSNWNVSNVTTMTLMFGGCIHFSGHDDLGKWNVSNVTTMDRMFYKCHAFDADLSNWNVSNVQDVRYMFVETKSFHRDVISSWDLADANVTGVSEMFIR